jgi:hypothetical protein
MNDCQAEIETLLKQALPYHMRFTDSQGETEETTWKQPETFDPFDL